MFNRMSYKLMRRNSI